MEESRRGNLLGLAIVAGLLGFFVADAVTGGPASVPGGNAVAAFFIAAGVVLVLFLVAVAVAALIRRVRPPASSPTGAVEVRVRRPPPRRSPSARGVPVEVAERMRPAPPGSDRYFLRTVHEFLAAVDTLRDDQVEWIEDDLLRFAASAAPVELARLADSWEAWRLHHEVDQLLSLADRMTGPQLRYLSDVIMARRTLR